jgi:uncharacterized protein with GYD domain
MPYYLVQATYTAKAWAAMLKNPQDRVEAVRPAVEKLGGNLESAYLAFGDYDGIAIIQIPDNVSAAAISMALMAGGALKAIKTTPLMKMEEWLEAMEKASTVAYRPPDSSPIFLKRE